MLNDITNIKFSGVALNSEASFNLFPSTTNGNVVSNTKCSILFGRNGTGKSTIAKAFRKLKGEDMPAISNAEFLDVDGNIVSLTDEEKKHIFIYDEDYVINNVKMQEDHLDTIVVLGLMVDIENQLSNEKDKCKQLEIELALQSKELDKYNDENNKKSHLYYWSCMKEDLRYEDSWAERDKEIKGNTRNSPITDEVLKSIIKLKLNELKSKKELITIFNDKLKILKNSIEGRNVIDDVIPEIAPEYLSYDDDKVYSLLATKIERPILTDREKKILNLLCENGEDIASERLKIFKIQETTECPYCYQPLTSEYKKSIVDDIEKVLREEVNIHIRILKKYILPLIEIDIEPFEKLRSCQRCKDLIYRINEKIRKNNEKLEEKKVNPYDSIQINKTMIKEDIQNLKKTLSGLENERKEYNEEAKETDTLVDELHCINDKIARYDIHENLKLYNKQKKEYNAESKKLKMIKIMYDLQCKKVNDLEEQKKNKIIATNHINAWFKYIFFSEDRLKIELDGSNYKLYSNGQSIKPCNVSVGERNIIGLCYFFASILEGKDENNVYKEEYILVLDDPISSFDLENRIGILSFLKYQLETFLSDNVNTKVLIMTHDLATSFDIHKIYKGFIKTLNFKEKNFKSFEIESWKIEEFKCEKRHEYSELLKTIYRYAIGQENDKEIIIGNIMRQVLEAFLTFTYKKGIDEVTYNAEILDKLPSDEYRNYFKNSMDKLILNGGSHLANRIRAMKDIKSFFLVSMVEKQRAAKDILCFIYLLNDIHLIEHLENCADVKNNLSRWCKDIENSSTNP